MVSARSRSRVKRRKTIRDVGEIVLDIHIAGPLPAYRDEHYGSAPLAGGVERVRARLGRGG